MRCSSIVLLSAIVFASPGCILYCENGLCSPGEPEAIFDPALLGEWEFFDPKPEKGTEGYFKFEREAPASKAYRITGITSPVDGKQTVAPLVFKAYLVSLGDSLFLDAIMPPERGDRDKSPRHLIWIVEIEKGKLVVRHLSEDFITAHPDLISRMVTSSPLGIKQVKVTATTKELGDFVSKHARNDAAWMRPGRLRRR